MEQAILVLERMAHEGNFLSLDPLLLLSRLYDRQQKYEKAISLLNRFKEVGQQIELVLLNYFI
jgi:hypothetical protein